MKHPDNCDHDWECIYHDGPTNTSDWKCKNCGAVRMGVLGSQPPKD